MATKLNTSAINLPAPFVAGSCDPIDARIVVETKSDLTTNAATTFGTISNIYCKIYEGIVVYVSLEKCSYMYIGPAVDGNGILLSEALKETNWIKTADANNPIGDLDNKVDKIPGKGLSSNDFTDELKAKLDGIAEGAEVSAVKSVNGRTGAVTGLAEIEDIPTKVSELTNDSGYLTSTDIANKVDKEAGKGLSSNDYTTSEKNKLASIEAGAQVNTITGVKGDAESTYRVGNINITKANIGLGNVTNDPQVKRSEMGVANGVATLDSSGKVPSTLLPSYVDDIIDVYATYDKSSTGELSNVTLYLDSAHTQSVVGEPGKIYLNVTENQPSYQFRWTGTVFAQTGASSLVLGEVTGTAYDGAKGKANADNIAKIKSTSLSKIEDFTTESDSVSLNYTTYSGEQYGSSGTGHSATIPAATSEKAGVMSALDKSKLDNLKSPLLIMYLSDFDALETKDSDVLYIVKKGVRPIDGEYDYTIYTRWENHAMMQILNAMYVPELDIPALNGIMIDITNPDYTLCRTLPLSFTGKVYRDNYSNTVGEIEGTILSVTPGSLDGWSLEDTGFLMIPLTFKDPELTSTPYTENNRIRLKITFYE